MHLSSSLVLILTLFKSLDCQVGNEKILNSRLNFFDTDLLRYAAEERRGNVMISPASIKSVLAMMLEGAGGDTEFEIRSALRLSPNKNDFRDQLFAYLLTLNANTSGVLLENANAVFISNKLKVRKDYEKMLRNVYLSEIANLNFMQPIESANLINSWVNKKTKGHIPSVIESGNINTRADIMVINALYFKGAWLHGFNHRNTRSECFYNKGVCKKVAMMEIVAELNYVFVENLRAHAVELPYEGGRYSMFLLVPQDRDMHNILIRDIPYMSLPQISDLMDVIEVDLSLPRFIVDYDEDMVPVLRNMKISSIFSTQSNLSGIFQGQSSQLNSLFHKVHMEVNEKGTVAAATTGAMVVPLISSSVQLVVDRPFLFFIRDNELGLVLFEGKIEEPTAIVEQNNINGFGFQGGNNQQSRHQNLFG